MSNHPTTTFSSTDNDYGVVSPPPNVAKGSKRKQLSQPRQLLSCTKCRKRKVKCDRTTPCSACCARGEPKECEYITNSGDFVPIQQSYEIRKLRQENLRLKERLRVNQIPIEDVKAEHLASPDSRLSDKTASSLHKRHTTRRRPFEGSKWPDSIYFGSPGLANVIEDFAYVNLTPMSTQSLAHLMPRGADMYTSQNPHPYPFATLFKATPDECIPELLSVLPARNELFGYLDAFQKRVHICSFPHIPTEITRSEVERFLSDARKNAQMCPDMLALLFSALALGSQNSVWDKSGGEWVASAMEEEQQKGNVYIAAAMQALRMASFMHKPTLLCIQALIMLGPYLTNSGRFLDAWTLFGTTIRLAQSIGLHRHPKYLDPAPPSELECSIRQTLWWWMLRMDEEYSMTLGRPLGISGFGDCPPPVELTTNPTVLRFGQFGHHFTILARQILSSDSVSNKKIDEFTDALKALLNTMPESLQFNETWLEEGKEIPEWPLGVMAAVFYCKIHNYLILLNRRLPNKCNPHAGKHPGGTLPPSAKAKLRGRGLVLSSSEDLLGAFLFFYARMPAALICWSMGQQAFNSCMILLLDAMETGDIGRIWKVEKAYAIFTELDKHGVHKLANLAVERVSWGLNELRRMGDQTMADVGVQLKAPRRWGDTEMQGVAGSEAMQGSGTLHDAVMGNTGMLLLEDPGLQAFVPEAFSPLSWGVASRGDLTDSKPLHLRKHMQLDQQEEGQKQGERDCDEEEEMDRLRESDDATRSSEGLQGLQGSAQGSAPLRCATFWTAPSQEHGEAQGPTLTSPMSPLDSTILMQRQHHLSQGMSAGLHQIPPPPHLRHHSYPSLHQHISAPPFYHPSALETHHQRINSFANPNPPPHPYTQSSPTTPMAPH
ncbi:hypothetical protein K505DRAFT_363937 [Melanomma pulvis-pyrius CBS 109.77]|uniref:Zn(2)-C6 fungal-type domain-containing protein n=1 Tax=Melanomma pulvis-pyrius CBS 109.77 TaxID=1314802 RepID=A0A6A6X4Y8_9PLEO|nr:hypothetical protein K505DRAFT_363937 [Melanomma pulvis-pyrius CBS 109.77]